MEPQFVQVVLHEGKIQALTERHDLYLISMGWDDLPIIQCAQLNLNKQTKLPVNL